MGHLHVFAGCLRGCGKYVHYDTSLDVDGYPDTVSVDDPKAICTVRWYRECTNEGAVLEGYQNSQCKNRYVLPMFGEHANAPVVDVSNHHVIDSVEMKKVPSMARVWEMTKGNKQMISRKLKEIQ